MCHWCTANINYWADIQYLLYFFSYCNCAGSAFHPSYQPPAHCWTVCETAPAVGLWALWNTFGLSLTWIDLPRHLDAIWDSKHMLSMLLDSHARPSMHKCIHMDWYHSHGFSLSHIHICAPFLIPYSSVNYIHILIPHYCVTNANSKLLSYNQQNAV